MSLNKLLAVGQSFAGVRGDKSPYEMRKEKLLPRFPGAPRFTKGVKPGEELVQTDWLESPAQAAFAAPSTPATEPAQTAAVSAPQNKGNGWLRFLTFGLLGRPKANSRLVQSELTLEKVQVLRNDLADSDLELVLKKKRPIKRILPEPVHSPKRQWNEMTARLFEIGQH